MEQAHVKIVKQLETKLAEFESVNKVCATCVSVARNLNLLTLM